MSSLRQRLWSPHSRGRLSVSSWLQIRGLQFKWKHRAENWLVLTAVWFIGTTLCHTFFTLRVAIFISAETAWSDVIRLVNKKELSLGVRIPLNNIMELSFTQCYFFNLWMCAYVHACVCGLGGVDGPNMRWPAVEWGNDLKQCSTADLFMYFYSLLLCPRSKCFVACKETISAKAFKTWRVLNKHYLNDKMFWNNGIATSPMFFWCVFGLLVQPLGLGAKYPTTPLISFSFV